MNLETLDDMSDLWRERKAIVKKERWERCDSSLKLLADAGIIFKTLSTTSAHYRPTTGRWIDRKNNKKGFGVAQLIKYIYKRT